MIKHYNFTTLPLHFYFLSTLFFLFFIFNNIQSQTIFYEDFGQHTTRTRCSYTPVGNIVNKNCFIYAEPTIPDNPTTSSVNESKYAKDIDNNHYAVIAPKYIANEWDPTDLGWYFWTSTTNPGPTPAAARAYVDDHTPGDTDGACLVLNAGTTLSSIYKRPIFLQANHYYKLSFWVYVVNSTADIKIKVMSPSGNSTLCSYQTGYLNYSGSWVLISPDFHLNAGCTSGYYTFDMINCNANDTGNDFYIDDILFEEIPSSGSPNTIICETTEPTAINDYSTGNTVGTTINLSVLNNDYASDGTNAQANANISLTLITPNGAKNYGTSTQAYVFGEGTWIWNQSTKNLSFTPESSFKGDPSPITYAITDNTNMTSAKAMVYISCLNTPTAINDTAEAYIGDPVTISVLNNDKLADKTTTPTASDITFQFVDIYGIVLPSSSTSLFVAQEGTWTYNNGQLTFTPLVGFTGDPSPIEYKITQHSTSTTSAPAWVIVNYKSTFTNPITPLEICSGSTVNYTATSSTAGTTFSWTRNVVSGISNNAASANSATINEKLYNSTSNNIDVTYIITYGIGSNVETQNLVVTVKPAPTVNALDQESCDAQTFTLSATANLANCTFEWKDLSNNVLSTTDTYLTPSINTRTTYIVQATAANSCTGVDTVFAMIYPRKATWNGSVDNDWFNENNWTTSPTNGGYPKACTDVTIPCEMPHYCIINHAAECHYITFKPEAGVYGLDSLTYVRAYVEMNVQRNKWYTLTTPLKEMFSADYYFEGTPVSYMKLFDAVNPDSILTSSYKYTGKWTRNFANLNTKLNAGQGFAFMLSSTEWNYPHGFNTLNTDYTIQFPRRKADSTLIVTDTLYNGLNGYKYRYLPVVSLNKDIAKVYRFANENSQNKIAPFTISLNPGLNLIGNPLMTHLKFSEILTHDGNASVIRNVVKIWNGTTFNSFIDGADFEASSAMTNSSYICIPPMQAFFVYSDAGGTITIDPSKDFTTNESSKLRSSKQKPKCLYIESNNGTYQSTCSVILNEQASNSYGKDDAFKLFSQYSDVPEIYTSSNNKCLDINSFKQTPYITPLGIYTNSNQNIELNFKCANSFDNCEVYLLNTATGETQNLKEKTTYNIEKNNNLEYGSLFLEFRAAQITTNSNTIKYQAPTVFIKGKNTIHIIGSEDEPILDLELWDSCGKQLYLAENINKALTELTIPNGKLIVFLKVVTEHSTKIHKLIIQ